jgi:hypothetical protein
LASSDTDDDRACHLLFTITSRGNISTVQ